MAKFEDTIDFSNIEMLDNQARHATPNLNDPIDSSNQTYLEAKNEFLMIIKEINSLRTPPNPNEAVALINDFSFRLGLCCEKFLKAIYVRENASTNTDASKSWEVLMGRRPVCDGYGYPMALIDGNVYHVLLDNNGNPVDQNGSLINITQNNSNQADIKIANYANYTYTDSTNSQFVTGIGRRKLMTGVGHDISYLVTYMLPPQDRILLEIMMTNYELTSEHQSVNYVDYLKEKGVVDIKQETTPDQYMSWLDQHRQTFVDARYGGQSQPSVDLRFLLFLTKQCKALCEYVLDINQEKTAFNNSEIQGDIPEQISNLINLNASLVSNELINYCISGNNEALSIIEFINNSGVIQLFDDVSANTFFEFVTKSSLQDAIYMIKELLSLRLADSKKTNFNELYHINNVFGNISTERILKCCSEYMKNFGYDLTEALTIFSKDSQKITHQDYFEGMFDDLSNIPEYEFDKTEVSVKDNDNATNDSSRFRI